MKRTIFISILAALTVSGPAYAQNPVEDTYGGEGNVTGEVAGNDTGTGTDTNIAGAGDDAGAAGDDGVAADDGASQVLAASSGDELPFTGLDIGLLAMGGVLLLALGLGMRRAGREPTV